MKDSCLTDMGLYELISAFSFEGFCALQTGAFWLWVRINGFYHICLVKVTSSRLPFFRALALAPAATSFGVHC